MIKLVGEKLQQYDTDRQVEVIPTGTVLEVKFLNRSPNAFEVAFAEENGRVYATIPNVLLKTFGVITCETLELLEDGSQIEQRMTFTVEKRKKPEGYKCPNDEILTPNYLKKSGGGGASDCDWNLMKNRPFGETTTAILVDNQTITLNEGIGSVVGFVVEESKTYTVIYNGVEYADLMGDVVDFDGEAVPYIGNTGLLTGGGDSEIPFLIITQDGMTAIADFSGIESCNITIIGAGIKTIDPKYLPKTKTRTIFYINRNGNDSNLYLDKDYSIKPTIQEVINAHTNGEILLEEDDGNMYYPSCVYLTPVLAAVKIVESENAVAVVKTYSVMADLD